MIERADYVIDIGPKAENLVVKSSAKERQPKSGNTYHDSYVP
jgi:excinuclease UvrABC ATPase subunit